MRKIYKRFENLTSAELWAIRNKVVVNSVFLADYENQYGISEVSLCNFFDGYYNFIWELAEEEHGKNLNHNFVFDEYDTEENLYNWYNCYEEFDWVVYDYDEDVNELAKDLVDGFEDELSLEKIKKIIITILQGGEYDMNELWHINIYDSTQMYDLLGKFGDYKK